MRYVIALIVVCLATTSAFAQSSGKKTSGVRVGGPRTNTTNDSEREQKVVVEVRVVDSRQPYVRDYDLEAYERSRQIEREQYERSRRLDQEAYERSLRLEREQYARSLQIERERAMRDRYVVRTPCTGYRYPQSNLRLGITYENNSWWSPRRWFAGFSYESR